MGLTGVMFAIVVVAWAMFLVPMALRRHDQAARSRSIERFSTSMRVLSKQAEADDRVVRPSLRSEPADPPVAVEDLVRPTRAAMKAAAARRRRVVVVLLAATVVVGALSAFGVVPIWSAAVPAALLVGFLWLARRQVRQANDSYWEWVSAARPEVSNVIRRDAARVDASHGSVRTAGSSLDEYSEAEAEAEADADADADEPTVALTAEQLAAAAASEERVVAVSVQTADGGSLWDPLPVTLPTYVDKPVAHRTIRTIELSDPGLFSSGHDEADSAAVAKAEAGRAGDADLAADAVETPRAANA